MAEKIVSPGVFTKENDLSFLQQGVSNIGPAFIGPFKEGPVVPTIVNTQADFETLFGTVDDTYYTPLAVQSYLKQAGVATICRVAGIGGYTEQNPMLIGAFTKGQLLSATVVSGGSNFTASNGTTTGDVSAYMYGGDFDVTASLSASITSGTVTGITIIDGGSGMRSLPTGIVISASAAQVTAGTGSLSFTFTGEFSASAKALAMIFNTDNDGTGFSGTTLNGTLGSGNFIINSTELGGTGPSAFTASLNPESVNSIEAVLGTTAKGVKGGFVAGQFKNTGFVLGATTTASFWVLDDQDFTIDCQEAQTPYIQSQLISGQRYNLFRFETIGAGTAANTKVKIGISNIKDAGSVQGSTYGSFTVTVRAFTDTDAKKVVLETFSGVNLDPLSPNYIYRVIGDRYRTIDSAGKITETGDWINNSKYIRLVNTVRDASLDAVLIPAQCVPFAHAPYKLPVVLPATSASLFPTTSYAIATTSVYGGIDLDNNADNKIYLKAIPKNATTGSNLAFSLDVTCGFGISGSGLTPGDIAKRNMTIAFQEGFDGMSPATDIMKGTDITAGNTQGFDLSTSTSNGSLAYAKHINALSNADEWDINMVVAPGVVRRLHTATATAILDMVEERADAFYIMDTTLAGDTISQAVAQAQSIDSNYAGTYYPWVKTIDINTNKLITVPPSVLLPGVYASNDRVAAQWFAPAGLNRGILRGAVSVLNRLTHEERDTLYENKVNPIAQYPEDGIVVWGQKTLQAKPSALDRINVRRLLLTIRKYIASTSKYLVFEQNTSTTRNKFINMAVPYLEGIQQRQGLYAFKVIMDETNNTPDVIDRNIMKGTIYLQPAKTAEFIVIDFNILPTGASFGG